MGLMKLLATYLITQNCMNIDKCNIYLLDSYKSLFGLFFFKKLSHNINNKLKIITGGKINYGKIK